MIYLGVWRVAKLTIPPAVPPAIPPTAPRPPIVPPPPQTACRSPPQCTTFHDMPGALYRIATFQPTSQHVFFAALSDTRVVKQLFRLSKPCIGANALHHLPFFPNSLLPASFPVFVPFSLFLCPCVAICRGPSPFSMSVHLLSWSFFARFHHVPLGPRLIVSVFCNP